MDNRSPGLAIYVGSILMPTPAAGRRPRTAHRPTASLATKRPDPEDAVERGASQRAALEVGASEICALQLAIGEFDAFKLRVDERGFAQVDSLEDDVAQLGSVSVTRTPPA